MPFAGCGARCVFCSQSAQTGREPAQGERGIRAELENCEKLLAQGRAAGKPAPQIAFYGGTFTALPERIWRLCLDTVQRFKKAQLIDSFRCSTRPDKLSPRRLRELSLAGCRLVELGIQTFADKALAASQRGYSGQICQESCKQIAASGMDICAHLLPGLPESSPEDFLEDIDLAIGLGVASFRFSPCLVLEGTKLAQMWREGKYAPQELDSSLGYLAEGYLAATSKGASVIRIGLAPEDKLMEAILAGPVHRSLGSRAQGLALFKAVERLRRQLRHAEKYELYLPEHCRGFLWGWRRELAAKWQNIGIGDRNVIYWNKNIARLRAMSFSK